MPRPNFDPKKLGTPFRVGLLVLLSGVFLFVFLTFARKGGLTDRDALRVWAYFGDASGLSHKSRVQIAGISVGEVEDIQLEGNRAKVFLRVRREVGLRQDAVLTKRSESLLGDYLIDLFPGTSGAPALNDGEQIARVLDRQGMEAVFASLTQITADIGEVTKSLRGALGGERGSASLDKIVENMVRLSSAVDETVRKSSVQLDAILQNVERVSADVRGLTTSQEDTVRTILENIRSITDDARAVSSTVRVALGQSDGGVATSADGGLAGIGNTLERLDNTLANLETVTTQIREGNGAVGKLVADERLGQKLGETIEDVSDLASRITQLQTEVSVRSEYLFAQGEAKNFFSLKLVPKPDKYYLIELVDDPRGAVETTLIQNNPPAVGQPATQVQRVTRDALKFSAQFAKRFYFSTLRFGIIESTGGIGADLHFFQDALSLKLDAFNFSAEELRYPRLRAAVRFQAFDHLFATVGMDDVLNPQVRDRATNQLQSGRDVFVGAGVYFTDDDLKALLTVAPIPSPAVR
ncbi:MAG: MlaD family protein [Myxococcaceae bacterium]